MRPHNNKLKRSSFNIVVPHPDGTLLYSQLSGALLLLDENHAQQYKSKLKTIKPNFRKVLKRGMFIIDFDEIKWMESISKKRNNNTLSKGVTIAPTDCCNLNCGYCFESKTNWILMTPETQEKTKIFVNKMITSSPTTDFSTAWFGGEPTLHLDCVENLSHYFKDICDKNKIKYTQFMVTNGTNLNESTSKRLKEIGCMGLQITIDGTQETHDEKRPFRSGCHSSYDAIMKNIPRLWEEGFQIEIRVNLDEKNLHTLPIIKSELEKIGLYKRSQNNGYINVHISRVFGNDNITQKEISEIWCDYPKWFNGMSCLAGCKSAFGISQNGVLTKCWEHITDEKHPIGTVNDLNLAETGNSVDYIPSQDKVCKKCRVLPTCWGGCEAHNGVWETQSVHNGCNTIKWNIEKRIIKLYESKKIPLYKI